MARMIPSVISPEIKSNAEKRIFEWFRDDSKTSEWIVLHSLGITNHNRFIHGEIDFLVLVPYMGIFALEVKGGRVSRREGIWAFTNKYGKTATKKRGPFDQAWDGIFSVINSIKRRLDNSHWNLSNVFFGIGVMFPDIKYTVTGCDEEQWQVFDSNDMHNVSSFIERLFEGSKRKWEELHESQLPQHKLPTYDDICYIASLLRGDFDKAIAMSVQMHNADKKLIELTKEQYRCLDQIEDNPRCLIMGAAGTGKTLLAIEEAKKAVAKGQKVALICFNRMLGNWLEKCFEEEPDNLKPLYVGTFHRYMLQVIKKFDKKIYFPEDESDYLQFFGDDVPVDVKNLIIQNNTDKFDKIIIDEAQDLINKKYLDVIDAALSKGFIRGEWTMLGDFSMQAIYSAGETTDDLLNILENRTSFIRFKLTKNCRNTKPICDEIQTVTGFIPSIKTWSTEDGPPVNYIIYNNTSEAKEKLEETIASLKENRVSENEITILSPVKRINSIVNNIERYEVKDYSVANNRCISFSTIQSFKGLENTVILLTDVNTYSDEKLMYVALSRAKTALYIFESVTAGREYIELQKRRLI